jgi:hypothetical protein
MLDELKKMAGDAWQNRKIRNRVIWGVAIFVVLQLYFVRELIAAELLFGMLFAFALALTGLFYVVGTIGMKGLDWTEMGVRVVATTARRGYSTLEEISKKPFRHPHSESAR